LGQHLTAHFALQNPFTAVFQSFDTLLRRLFVFDAVWNPRPFWDAPRLQSVLLVTIKVTILVATAVLLGKLARHGVLALGPSIGVLGIVTLLLAPATATYHLLLLWLPVALLIDFLMREGSRACAYLILGAYTLIGFLDLRLTNSFEGRGGLSILAYPRLFLLLGMFVVCLYALGRSSERARKLTDSRAVADGPDGYP
jgi:hypothetical protein